MKNIINYIYGMDEKMIVLEIYETAVVFQQKCKKNTGKIIGLAGCIISPFCAAAEPDFNKIMPRISDQSSQMQAGIIGQEAPIIDGIISPGEWDSAAMLNGFHELNGDIVPEKSGFVYVMSDEKFLYLAIKTITLNDSPGGGLISTVNKRDGQVYDDDCVELTFNGENEPDFIKQLIFNPNGFLFDSRRRVSVKDVDISWDIQGMEAKSRVESFWWVLELKIPLSQLDIKNGKLRFNVLRRWLELGLFSTIKRVQKYFDPQEMIELSLNPGGMIIRQEELGNPSEGDWKIKFFMTNTSSHELIFAVMLHNYVWPKIDGKVTRVHTVNILKSKNLKPGESGTLEGAFEAEDNRLFWLSSGIVDTRTGRLQPHRRITAKKSRSLGRQPVYANGELQKNGNFIAYDYPGFGYGVIKFNFKGTPPESLLITSPDGIRETVKFSGSGNRRDAHVPIGSKPGKYSVSLSNGIPVCDFYRKEFKWQDNKYGTEKVVLPPFTPLLAEKEQIDVMFRKHRINGFGLWDSILSKEQELLQSPMRFELVSDGKNADWRFLPLESQVKNAGHDAEYKTRAISSTGVIISVDGKAEYDGFFWNRFTIDNPQQLPIDRLTLVIPLKNQMVPLYHIVSNTIRTNPTGFLPTGQGKLWDGTQLVRQLHAGKAVMHRQLVPYVWLGGVERGLCWFLDSSFGYNLSPVHPMVRISRHDQEVRLEVDIVNIPTTQKKWTFEFGLQATPVKPINPELFKMTRDMRGWTADKIPNLADFNQVRGGFPSQWAAMPLAGDYSLYRTVISLIRNGQLPDKGLHNDIENFFMKYKSVLDDGLKSEYPNRPALVVASARSTASLADPRRKPSRPMMYTDPHLVYRYEDAVRYFKSEWWNPAVVNYTAAYRVTLTPTLQDYLLHSMHELLACGLRGINLDDAYLMPDDNPDTMAKVDSQGVVHSEIGILRMRNYIKRLATMMHVEFKIYPRYIEPHMTNGLIIPIFSFVDGQLGFEQHYGENLVTERFSIGEILATYTGRQIGAKPVGLHGIKRRNTPRENWDKKWATLSRSSFALMMPFGIAVRSSVRDKYFDAIDPDVVYEVHNNLAEFGIAEDDCIFVPCFENDGAVLCDQTEVQVASYRRPEQALVIISNFSKTPLKIRLKINSGKLGIPAKFQILNWESRKAVDGEFILAPGNFNLLRLGR